MSLVVQVKGGKLIDFTFVQLETNKRFPSPYISGCFIFEKIEGGGVEGCKRNKRGGSGLCKLYVNQGREGVQNPEYLQT